jgi:micrococcal nuclease
MRVLWTLVVLAIAAVGVLRAAGGGVPGQAGTSTAAPEAGAGVRDVPADAQPAVVASITDGDTLRVEVEGRSEPVRLLELDSPEVTGDCGGAEASAALTTHAPVGSTVWLEADVEDRDRYGRLLRYVWRADGTMVNRVLVRRGWARAKLYPPSDRHWHVMRRAGARAEARGAGLWRRCGWTAEPAPAPPDTSGMTSCDPNYTGCVPRHPPDVDCDRADGPVTVLGADPHALDGDGDRRACEPAPG